jgi:hypothetical protein
MWMVCIVVGSFQDDLGVVQNMSQGNTSRRYSPVISVYLRINLLGFAGRIETDGGGHTEEDLNVFLHASQTV